MKTVLTAHLYYAQQAITEGNFATAMHQLRLAMTHVNKLQRRDLKSLVFRAMNHVRSAQKIANDNYLTSTKKIGAGS